MGRLARVGDLRGAVRPLAPGDGGGGRKPVRRPASPAGVACGAGLAARVGGPGCRGLLPALRQTLPGRRVRVHQHFAYAGLRGRHPGARDGGHRHRAVRSARAPRSGPVHARDDEAALPFEGDDTWSLLLHWSAKETLFKCLDAEGVDFRRHLRIIPFRPARRGVFHAREYRTGERRRFFVRYLLHPGFVLTWTAG